jgi:Holliday junction DNA helicase RuvB
VVSDRIQTPALQAEDELDISLRPRRLDEFVGQEPLKAQLGVAIQAAAARGEALDHVLLAGPPGLGKTSLAQIVAAELDVPFVQTAGPALERKADIAAFLTALEPRSVFFVDEIHRLPRAIEHYGPDDLARIVVRSSRVLGVDIDSAGACAIAERSRGTPRVANRLLKRVRDFSEVHGGGGPVDAELAGAALDLLEVDHEGLDRLDREILSAICARFGGGPVGLSTLSVAVGEESDTIEDVYEPYLLQRGFIKRTPRGRCATTRAFAHLGLEPPVEHGSLF